MSALCDRAALEDATRALERRAAEDGGRGGGGVDDDPLGGALSADTEHATLCERLRRGGDFDEEPACDDDGARSVSSRGGAGAGAAAAAARGAVAAAELDAALGRLDELCSVAAAQRPPLSLLLDAEETTMQPAVDHLARVLMARHNNRTPDDADQPALVLNTYQMYLRDARARLEVRVARRARPCAPACVARGCMCVHGGGVPRRAGIARYRRWRRHGAHCRANRPSIRDRSGSGKATN
jgi:hypothetical protein